MAPNSEPRQSDRSVHRNVSYFRDHLGAYGKGVRDLDTYASIRESIAEALRGTGRLLDIGNGGVFDYDVSLAGQIVALDLFLDEIDTSAYPPHVTFRAGSALDIPEQANAFDASVMVMLLHHIVGRNVAASVANLRVAIGEAMRVVKPGGKLVVIESCVPGWFYALERLAFPLASRAAGAVLSHPMTLQYPVGVLGKIASEFSSSVEVQRIPKGRWVLQFGFKFPSALTPVQPYRLILNK